MLMEGKRSQLIGYPSEAVKEIRANWSLVASGKVLNGRAGTTWRWAFGKVPSWDREDNTPSRGIKITLVGPGLSFDDYLDPEALPETLASSIDKICAACSAKFASYGETRRILLLDPHGDLQTETVDWWKKVWAHKPPPPAIGEIWSGVLDWVTDETQDWVFEQLYFTASTHESLNQAANLA